MITAHFMVEGEEREVREVEPAWLETAHASQENVLLTDGNTYRVRSIETRDDGHARVELEAPRFARGS